MSRPAGSQSAGVVAWLGLGLGLGLGSGSGLGLGLGLGSGGSSLAWEALGTTGGMRWTAKPAARSRAVARRPRSPPRVSRYACGAALPLNSPTSLERRAAARIEDGPAALPRLVSPPPWRGPCRPRLSLGGRCAAKPSSGVDAPATVPTRAARALMAELIVARGVLSIVCTLRDGAD